MSRTLIARDAPSTPEDKARLRDMLESRRAPGLKGTDTQNFRGVAAGNPFPNMPESLRQSYIRQAKAAGVDINGKVYKSGLVRKGYGGLKFDPQALVDSTHDIKKIVEQRGWSCEGMVNVKGPSFDDHEEKPYEVADSIVDEHAAHEVVEKHGGRIKKKAYKDLRQKIKNKLEGKT